MTRRIIAVVISIGLLAALWFVVDAKAAAQALATASPWLLVAGVAMLIPPLALTAFRFAWIARIPFGEALRLTMAAQSLNLFLPASAGDMAKAAFMARVGGGFLRLGSAIGVVAYEKIWDLAALLAVGVVSALAMMTMDLRYGWAAAALAPGCVILTVFLVSDRALKMALRMTPLRLARTASRIGAGWRRSRRTAAARRGGLARLAIISFTIWFMHMAQIWLLGLALEPSLSFGVVAALAPLGIVAGLAPFAVAGVGPRDLAFAALFAPFMGAPAAAAFGGLTALRYVAPAIAGAPFAAGRISRLKFRR